MTVTAAAQDQSLHRARYRLLVRIDRALRVPMLVLGVIWVVLVIVELMRGLSPVLEGITYVIWGLFVLQFLLEFVIAPEKLRYLRRSWITVLALLAPAFRLLTVFRVARAFTVMRGTQLVRVVGGANRGMRVLGRVMDRRGFGYVLLLTLLVAIAGGAGMFAFERGAADTRFESFGSSFWWAAMTLTTMGTDYFPTTAEGRVLCLLLAIYGFAVFGYVTATVASYFVARDAETDGGEIAGAHHVAQLQRELAALHAKLDELAGRRAPS